MASERAYKVVRKEEYYTTTSLNSSGREIASRSAKARTPQLETFMGLPNTDGAQAEAYKFGEPRN